MFETFEFLGNYLPARTLGLKIPTALCTVYTLKNLALLSFDITFRAVSGKWNPNFGFCMQLFTLLYINLC